MSLPNVFLNLTREAGRSSARSIATLPDRTRAREVGVDAQVLPALPPRVIVTVAVRHPGFVRLKIRTPLPRLRTKWKQQPG